MSLGSDFEYPNHLREYKQVCVDERRSDSVRGQIESTAGDALVASIGFDADGDGALDDVRATSQAFARLIDLIGVSNADLSDRNFAGSCNGNCLS